MTNDPMVSSTHTDQPASPGRTALVAVALTLVSGFVYLLIAGGFRFDFQQSSFTHHLWTADAFLHGQLHVREELIEARIEQERGNVAIQLDQWLRENHETISPSERKVWIEERARLRAVHDWTIVDGKLYGYWGPLTAVASIPWVMLFGTGVSDRMIGAVFGAINVGLFYWILRRVTSRGLLTMSETCRIALTVLFAFGTVHFFLSCAGKVWYTSQIVTLTALLCAVIAALSARLSVSAALIAGACFGAAFLGRNVTALTGLFFGILFWQRADVPGCSRLRTFVTRMLALGVPCAAAVGVQAWYNHARFGDALESGQKLQILTAGEERFVDDYLTYGQFHPHFLATNFKHYFWNLGRIRQPDGRLAPDPNGNAMFVVTPPLVYALLAWRQRRRFLLAVVAGMLPVLVALLLFRASGYLQFGNRYLLDAIPFLLLLVCAGMRGRLTAVSYSLIVLAVIVNLYGTYWMCRPMFVIVEQWVGWRPIIALVLFASVGGIALKGSGAPANE